MAIRINRVYTRQGDRGQTKLVGGQSVSKACLQVESYGEVDELNSFLGIVKELASTNSSVIDLAELISCIQQELFDVGAELATPIGQTYPGMTKVQARQVENLERLCDLYSESLPELTSFILPGGSLLVANLHVARAVARRVERAVVRFFEEVEDKDQLNWYVVFYLNRLNDLLFILARWCLLKEGREAPLWHPTRVDLGKL